MEVKGKYFYGNEVSEYGQKNGYVDYGTLAKAFNAVMNNDIISKTFSIGEWECINGQEYDEETGYYSEVFQWYIIDNSGVDVLTHWTDEIIYHNEELDLYLWGVTHFGTSWDYVLTDIECLKSDDKLVYDEPGDE